MSYEIEITENADGIPSDAVLKDEAHSLTVRTDLENEDVHLEFSSREAMRDFAKSLLHESLYGAGEVELFPLGTEKGWQVVNGVRLSGGSSRLFVWHPK